LTRVLGAAVAAITFLLALALLLVSLRWNGTLEVLAPPRDLSQQERILREKLNNYEKSADELKTIASLLLGISTLYGLALGVGSYINVQEAKGRADETLQRITALENRAQTQVEGYEKRLDKQETDYQRRFEAELKRFNEDTERNLNDIRREFPLFRNMQGSIRKISTKLQEFIPDADYGRDKFQKIDPNDRVMIEHYERAIASFEFFTLQPFGEDAARIYTMLGSYYAHKYARESSASAKKSGPAPDAADISRARWYLTCARQIAPKNIAPLNELGYLDVIATGDGERALPSLEKSIELYPEQQRARYYLSIIMHLRGNAARTAGKRAAAITNYQNSVEHLSKALATSRWQTVEEPALYYRAICYNRACAYARLGESAEQDPERKASFRRAVDDLNETFPPGQAPDEQRKIDFAGDLQPDGDFFAMGNDPDFKDALDGIRKRVGV
jgi:tetratricopeptide (TPR) repeat protein